MEQLVSPPEELPAAWLVAGAAPLELDIGCHRGVFLAEMARLYPERNFLGIERQTERVARTQKKIDRLLLSNARVLQGEGAETLARFPAACATVIHVLFPDPWPKRRHHSRRLVQEEFLRRCAVVLRPGGWLRLVTDDEPYAAAMRELAPEARDYSVVEEGDGRDYPLTEFQKKFLGIGKPAHSLFLRRRE